MSQSLSRIVQRLNDVEVTPADVMSVIEAGEDHHKSRPDDDGWEVGMHIIARLFKGQPQKAMAVHARMEALSVLLDAGALPGWTLEHIQGLVPVEQSMLEAVATEPLVMDGDRYSFDAASLSARALRIAPAEGQA